MTAVNTAGDVFDTFSDKKRRAVDAVATAAAQLFDSNGYAETSLRDISTAAGLSKGGIYHYFSNKHEILFYILDRYLDVLHYKVADELKKFDDPKDKLRFFLDRHLRIYLERMPEGGGFLNHVRDLPQRELRCIIKKQKDYVAILTQILAEMTEPESSNAKLKAVSYFIFGLYNSIMQWYDPAGDVPIAEASEMCYQLLIDGWDSLSSSELLQQSA